VTKVLSTARSVLPGPVLAAPRAYIGGLSAMSGQADISAAAWKARHQF
jgi:hypothetical protein